MTTQEAESERKRQRQWERGEALLASFERVMERDWPDFRNSTTSALLRQAEEYRRLSESFTHSEEARPSRQRVHDIWMSAITALLAALLIERLLSRLFGGKTP